MHLENNEHVKKCYVEHVCNRYGDDIAIIREVQVAEQVNEFQGENLIRFADAKVDLLQSKYDEINNIDSRRQELADEIQAITRVETFDQYMLLKDVCEVTRHSQHDDGSDK